MQCRASTDIKECCVCMKRLNKNNSVKITCNHGICKSCIDNIISHHNGSNIIKCPICRREYPLWGQSSHHNLMEPILFKTFFKMILLLVILTLHTYLIIQVRLIYKKQLWKVQRL